MVGSSASSSGTIPSSPQFRPSSSRPREWTRSEPSVPTLCRMHRGGLIGDVFSSSAGHGGKLLEEAVDAIEHAGVGVIVYLPPERDEGIELVSPDAALATEPHAPTRPHGGTLREYGLGAQVLSALGVDKLRLLTNNPKRIAALHGYGLDLVECVPLGPR